MQYKIENEFLSVEVDHVGAQLWSIRSKVDNNEYLWQGDPTSWADRAINLFPICCRLWEGGYTYGGKKYEMGIHGFLWTSETTLVRQSENSIAFKLESNEETLAAYPFAFNIEVSYTLVGNRIDVCFGVRNHDDKTMPFTVGGHPGFNVPFDGGEFSDYVLEFSEVKPLKAMTLTQDCFLTQNHIMMPLEGGRRMHLSHSLFDNDALVLCDCAPSVTLKRKGGNKAITVTYEQMPYLGIWSAPKKNAPYLCIEPWTGLPSYSEKVDDLETKTGMYFLQPGETKTYDFSIAIEA